ncbi:RPII140-upstream protein [Blattella germanica]|nr:RPII140-upstream protein [Blattella germanica]PSN52642.1 RPII140-upstream protein [Blattella germanica]
MLRRIGVNSKYISTLLPLTLFSEDPDKVEDSKTSQSIYKSKENETGWDRLYMMYTKDEFGGISPELNSAFQAGYVGLFVGACYGGIINSKVAYVNFMERNEATAFRSHLEAKKKLQDQVTLGFGKGAFRWGWRLGLFSSTYVLITTTIAVYRGHSSIVEYTAAGALTGALFKCNLGLRGIVVGGGLGGVLGGIAGLASLGILKMTGMTMEEVRYWQHEWKTNREKRFRKGDNTEDVLLKHHDMLVAASPKSENAQEENDPIQSKTVK